MPKQLSLKRRHKIALTDLAEGNGCSDDRALTDLAEAGYVSGTRLTPAGAKVAADLLRTKPAPKTDE